MRGILIKKTPADAPMDWPGISVYFVIGRWGGIGGGIDGGILRMCLGWLGIGLCGFDLERFLGALSRQIQKDYPETRGSSS